MGYFNPEELKRYFGKCRVFKSRQEAQDEVFRMEREILESHFQILEYGISPIRSPGKFPQ